MHLYLKFFACKLQVSCPVRRLLFSLKLDKYQKRLKAK